MKKKLIIGAIAISLISGVVGGYVANRWFDPATQSTVGSGGTVTKDSLALAEVIKEVSPSVVSITTSDQSAGSACNK